MLMTILVIQVVSVSVGDALLKAVASLARALDEGTMWLIRYRALTELVPDCACSHQSMYF